MTILRDPLRLKLAIAFVPILLALSNIGVVERVFAHGKLVVAIQPSVSSDEMLKKAQPLEKFLRDGLGGKTDVQIYVPSSFAAVLEYLRFGHAQVAFMSAWPAQLAVQLAGAEVALAEVREVIHGTKKVEAPYQNLQALKGKTACFLSPISTSGYVAPMGRLVELNLIPTPEGREGDPKAFFKEVLFGGGYGQCVQALKQGQVDVIVIAGDVPAKRFLLMTKA